MPDLADDRDYLREAYQIASGEPLPLSGCFLLAERAHVKAALNYADSAYEKFVRLQKRLHRLLRCSLN